MIEVAVVAVKSALREEFPDFVVPYENQREKAETNETNTQENKTEESTTEENVI